MAMLLHGGRNKKNKSAKKRSWDLKGGNSPSPLSPASLDNDNHNLGPVPRGGANYEENPLTVPSSTMIGGGYGFTSDSAENVSSYGGSYFPVSKVSTGGSPDNNSRGGNNFGQGGGSGSPNPFSPAEFTGGGKKKRRGGLKNKRRTMKKWRQRGCSRKGSSKKKTKGKRRH